MKNIMKYSLWLLVLVGAASCSNGQQEPTSTHVITKQAPPIYQNLEVNEFKSKMETNPGLVLDVRTPEEVEQGKIKGAMSIDYYADDFKSQIEKIDRNQAIYVYCASGGRSGRTMQFMKGQGFTEVYNLSGGMGAWLANGLPVE